MWFVNDSVRCRLPVRVDTLHKAWLLTPTPRLRAGPGGRTARRIGLRLRKTKGLCSAGGIYRTRDRSGRGETVTAGASGDDYTPLSQLRSRTEARQWERETETDGKRDEILIHKYRGGGNDRTEKLSLIVFHVEKCPQVSSQSSSDYTQSHRRQVLSYRLVERVKRWNNTTSGASDTFLFVSQRCVRELHSSAFFITSSNSSLS